MVFVEPAAQPTLVTTVANQLWKVTAPDGLKGDNLIARIIVIPTGGIQTTATVTVSSDPAVATRRKQIAKFTGVTAAAPVDHDNAGAGYKWDHAEGADIWFKIVPDVGADNSYDIRVHFVKRV